jgi:DNA-binding MarR family transcriptional regulator
MLDDEEARKVAAAVQLGIGFFTRQLRQAPVEEGGLTFSELLALSRLDRVRSATTSALARAEQITPQAMGATVAALEERGLVERRPDDRDGRRVLVSMTEAGGHALEERRDARTEQMARVLANRFTRAELKALMTAAPLLERLGEGLS